MRKIITGIAIGVVLIIVVFALGMCASLFTKRIPFTSGNVALYKISGTITTADDTLEDLEDIRKDTSIKALVLRIDSPGGSVGASQEIYEEVKRVASEKPVVVSMGDVAASGGYYIACGAKKIFANPGTITGSIGVRMEHVNLKDLLTWAKVGHETLKSGEYKDIGAFDRDMTTEERALLQNVLANMHAQFKKAISTSRNIPIEDVNKIADGRIYTGEQALSLGLIDAIGTLTDAVKAAGEIAGIKGEPKIKKFGDETPWWLKFIENKAGRVLAVYKLF